MKLNGYVYTCAGGETFDSIARLIWKDEKYAAELMAANPERCTKTVFDGGEYLLLPVINAPEETTAREPRKAPWKE